MKVDVKALAMTCGILWGVGLFLMTWWMILWEGATGEPTWLSVFYRGYTVSPLGSLIGLAWAVPDGVIGGAVVGWLYNRLARPSG